MTYRLKFNALPGDDPNAEANFGAANCAQQGATNFCSGNGNGYFEPTPRHFESMRATQHLSLAGLVKGSFSGMSLAPAEQVWEKAAIGGYYNLGNPRQFGAVRGKTYGNFIMLGNPPPSGLTGTPLLRDQGVISAMHAKSIDTKIDDGLADGGKVIATNGSSEAAPLCTNTTSMVTGTYNVDVPDEKCIMVFYMDNN